MKADFLRYHIEDLLSFLFENKINEKIKNISTHLLIMEVDFCPALCIPKVAVLQAFWGISHFVWYCKAVSDLS
ncbi:hypothetical protein G4925_07210 [Anaerostipes hadrus]|nr:hypothetical protein [Anaerostipes hadrus]